MCQRFNAGDYVALITAKRCSERLTGKNMLPLGGVPLAHWSIRQAQAAGLDVVVSTDDVSLLRDARDMGCVVVFRREAENALSHAELMRWSVLKAGFGDRHVVLLQPTSPFRGAGLIERCLAAHVRDVSKTVITCHEPHVRMSRLDLGKVVAEVGNVIIFNSERIGDHGQRQTVWLRDPLEALQVDNERDYVQACWAYHRRAGRERQVSGWAGGRVTLVARPAVSGVEVPQDLPVCYLNHCRGYVGGRADVLCFVANARLESHLLRDARFLEVLGKCERVLVRDGGALQRVRELGILAGKRVEVLEGRRELTTGVVAAEYFGDVRLVGFATAGERGRMWARGSGFYKGISEEVAILADFDEWL